MYPLLWTFFESELLRRSPKQIAHSRNRGLREIKSSLLRFVCLTRPIGQVRAHKALLRDRMLSATLARGCPERGCLSIRVAPPQKTKWLTIYQEKLRNSKLHKYC